MQLTKTLSAFAALLALASPAAAQMYPGQDVIVNPNAIPRGEMLLYPGGVYMRAGHSGASAPIHLHMPRQHHHVAKVAKPETTVAMATPNAGTPPPDSSATAPLPAPVPDIAQTPDTTAASPPPPKKSTRHKHPTATASTAPAATTDSSTAQSGGDLPLMFAGDGPAPSTPAQPPAAQSKPTKMASTEPSSALTNAGPSDAAHQNLFKRGAIMFVQGATDPSPVQFDGVKKLAADLNAALEAGAARIQLEAYGGTPGDKSSDARRLSLKRALAVRQLLIDDGVPSARIDVRAMGGIDDKGPVDRVDVFVRAS